MALVNSVRKPYSISMTKKLLTLAAFVRDEWMRQVSLDLQAIPSLRVQEKTVLLNRTEAAFVDAETRHLLEGQRQETLRKRRLGIPPPPAPGSIAYAVYY